MLSFYIFAYYTILLILTTQAKISAPHKLMYTMSKSEVFIRLIFNPCLNSSDGELQSWVEHNSRCGSVRMAAGNLEQSAMNSHSWSLENHTYSQLTRFQLPPTPNDDTEMSERTHQTAEIKLVDDPVQFCGGRNCQQGARGGFQRRRRRRGVENPCECRKALNPNPWGPFNCTVWYAAP